MKALSDLVRGVAQEIDSEIEVLIEGPETMTKAERRAYARGLRAAARFARSKQERHGECMDDPGAVAVRAFWGGARYSDGIIADWCEHRVRGVLKEGK